VSTDDKAPPVPTSMEDACSFIGAMLPIITEHMPDVGIVVIAVTRNGDLTSVTNLKDVLALDVLAKLTARIQRGNPDERRRPN